MASGVAELDRGRRQVAPIARVVVVGRGDVVNLVVPHRDDQVAFGQLGRKARFYRTQAVEPG